ncbi:hypothetical protein C7S20_03560 [Christiangramia fulva]|uniref:Uncharacterized protein n=1 Tax=Christiangramia fulva TaxID=2126553 RepID=A0A2R3Z2A9_9FLAO|nr:hypothetical protein [Christiangramia fulva]AVR44407.1 hypothetical protein C7S20_03560 [Christiangramia fulva]
MPDSIKSGWVTFHFTNAGTKTHVARIARLKNDISRSEFDSIRAAGEFPEEAAHSGGPGLHSPGESSSYTTYLEPGNYEVACFLRTKDDKLHANLGMMRYFRVTEEVGNDSPPESDMQIDLDAYHLKTKGDLHKGRQTVRIDGKEGKFDVHLVKLEDESTMKAMLDYFEDLTDPTLANFLGGTEEGNISYFTVDLEPGNYMWGSDEYGKWGMYEGFEITQDDKFHITKNPSQEPVIQEVTFNLDSSGIKGPKKLSSGKTTFNIHLSDTTAHRIGLAKLKEGKTKEDVYNWIKTAVVEKKYSGPPPLETHHHLRVGKFPSAAGKQDQSITVGRLLPGN